MITWVSNSDHMVRNNNNMLSYVIGQDEQLALKGRSFTANKERSRFELIITDRRAAAGKSKTDEGKLFLLGSCHPSKMTFSFVAVILVVEWMWLSTHTCSKKLTMGSTAQ